MKKYLIWLIILAFIGSFAFPATIQARARNRRRSATRKREQKTTQELRKAKQTIRADLERNNTEDARKKLKRLADNKRVDKEAINLLRKEIKAKEEIELQYIPPVGESQYYQDKNITGGKPETGYKPGIGQEVESQYFPPAGEPQY